jgi:hypothetical protein
MLIRVITKLPNSEQSYLCSLFQDWVAQTSIKFKSQLNLKYIFKPYVYIYVTEYGTALTTVLPILFLYLNTVIETQPSPEIKNTISDDFT